MGIKTKIYSLKCFFLSIELEIILYSTVFGCNMYVSEDIYDTLH